MISLGDSFVISNRGWPICGNMTPTEQDWKAEVQMENFMPDLWNNNQLFPLLPDTEPRDYDRQFRRISV